MALPQVPTTRSAGSPSAGAQPGSTAIGSTGPAGKSSVSTPSPPRPQVSTPLRVWNRASPPSTWAEASVAWPHRSISVTGVNHRRSWSPSARGTTNAVSDRLSSAATACIHASVVAAASTHTPAGLPANGTSVNASTTVIGWATATTIRNLVHDRRSVRAEWARDRPRRLRRLRRPRRLHRPARPRRRVLGGPPRGQPPVRHVPRRPPLRRPASTTCPPRPSSGCGRRGPACASGPPRSTARSTTPTP